MLPLLNIRVMTVLYCLEYNDIPSAVDPCENKTPTLQPQYRIVQVQSYGGIQVFLFHLIQIPILVVNEV